MISLLSALAGFFSAALPDMFKLLRDRADRKHELAILQLQLEQQRAGHAERLEDIRGQADAAEAQAIYATYATGIEWVDALNGTVRPVLAYAFFLLYAVIKLCQFSILESATPEAFLLMWNIEDQAIFAGIISFYFGQRAMGKFRK